MGLRKESDILITAGAYGNIRTEDGYFAGHRDRENPLINQQKTTSDILSFCRRK